MKKLILLSLTAMFIFSSVSVFACGNGEANGDRVTIQSSESDTSSDASSSDSSESL